MSDRTKGFDHLISATVFDRDAGVARLDAEAGRLQAMMRAAAVPQAMRAAPAAPARGTMRLVENWVVQPGGTRRSDGAHWINASALDVENHFARAGRSSAAVEGADGSAQAARQDRSSDLFTAGQLAMADRYRSLTEWRAGSAVKCAKLDGGCGGPDGRDYMDGFIAAGDELRALVQAIGDAVVLTPRRSLDRDNARRTITVRMAVDGVVLDGLTISKLLRKEGWAPDMKTRRVIRDAIRGALDRMQGYRL